MSGPKDTVVRVCRSDVAWLLDALAEAPWWIPSTAVAQIARIGAHCAVACVDDVVMHDHRCKDVVSLSAYDLAEALAAVDPMWAYEIPSTDAAALRSHPAVVATDTLTDEMRRQAPTVWDAVMSDITPAFSERTLS